MMKFDLASLVREIESAESFRDTHLVEWKSLIERFHGPSYRESREQMDDPENFILEYIALLLPRIVHDNPTVRVKSARPVSQSEAAGVLQVGINRWCKMVGIRNTLERIATDMLLAYGVALTVNEPRKGYVTSLTEDPYLPRVYRISPDRFFIDPAATHLDEARYMGHCWITDRDDLLASAESDKTWDIDVIERVAANTGVSDVRDDTDIDRNIPDRKELVVYEVWVPELHDEAAELIDAVTDRAMFNGTIYTVVKGQAESGKKANMGMARAPRPYYGPRTGPYTVFGAYTVPDDPYPLSPIMALMPQIDDVNMHLRNMRYSASAYKRLLAVDARNAKMAQDIRDREDLYVVLADNLDPDALRTIEVGGITAQQVQYASMAQDRLDRVSGIHDAMRGNVSGNATATEVQVAESSSGLRISHLKRQFQESVNRCLRSVGWFMFYDDKVVFPVGEDGIAIMGEPEPIFSAMAMVGVFDDLDIDVEAYSMERVSEGLLQRRSVELLQVIGNISQAVVAAPHVDWKQVLSVVGNAMNMPNLGDMIDLRAVQQMRAQAQQAAAGAQAGRPQPRSVQEIISEVEGRR
jgi:hypothetical protein